MNLKVSTRSLLTLLFSNRNVHCCFSRMCVVFLACVHLALFLALSLSPGNSQSFFIRSNRFSNWPCQQIYGLPFSVIKLAIQTADRMNKHSELVYKLITQYRLPYKITYFSLNTMAGTLPRLWQIQFSEDVQLLCRNHVLRLRNIITSNHLTNNGR